MTDEPICSECGYIQGFHDADCPISRAEWWNYIADRLSSLHRRVSTVDFQRDDDRVRQGRLLLTLDRAIAQATGIDQVAANFRTTITLALADYEIITPRKDTP